MIALASHTGWSMNELLDLALETFMQMLELLPKPPDRS